MQELVPLLSTLVILFNIMVTTAKDGSYKGEKTLLPDGRYPVTKDGKLNCGRVKNAVARAAQNGDTAAIVKGGVKTYLRKCGVEDSKLLKSKK